MIGKGGEGREATGEGGREGALDMGSPQRQAVDPPLKMLWTNFTEISGGVRCMTMPDTLLVGKSTVSTH